MVAIPYDIHVRNPYTTVAEDVAIKTAFDTLVTAIKAASAHRVDCGGTIIGLVKYTGGDEVTGSHVKHGDVW